jgi:hypothetical protein
MNITDTEIIGETLVQKSDADEAFDYGITTTQITYYHYGAYRYTNLKDAIAEAKLSAVARQLNERPRKTLQYQTPAEKFETYVAATR